MKDTKIKVKIDVMEVLKQVSKHCEKCECYKCEFAIPSKYGTSDCAISETPYCWKLNELKRKE